MRSILLYANEDSGTIDRVEAALNLAGAFNAHLHCLQMITPDTFVAMDPFGGVYPMFDLLEDMREREAKNKQEIDAKLQRADAPRTWIIGTRYPRSSALDRMALVDLTIVSIPQKDELGDRPPPPARLATQSNTPVLAIAPGGTRFDAYGNAMVAWNGSAEAARALCAAVPLLSRAENVTIVHIEEAKPHALSPTDAAEYLGYYEIRSDIREVARSDRITSEVLAEAAALADASYIVMGAYGHARLQERIFGGVTQALSTNSNVSLFMAH